MGQNVSVPPLQTPASWLFVKGEQTVWILRPEDFVLLIYGPGPAQKRHTFDGETSLEGFHVWLAEELMATGWILWGIDRDRRSGRDRRGSGRNATDRRMARQDPTPAAGPGAGSHTT